MRVLDPGSYREAGLHRLDWDGRDDRGRPLPPTTYLLRLDGGRERLTHKLTLAK